MGMVCRLFGHRARKYFGSPTYGRVEGGESDGIGRTHFRVYQTCERCGDKFHVVNFHGPIQAGEDQC